MAYCPNCGVELAAQARNCPLCGALAVDSLPDEERLARAAASLNRGEDANLRSAAKSEPPQAYQSREGRTLRWEILSVALFISALAVSGVNLLASGRMSWALYPLCSLAFLWVILSAIIELGKLPGLGFPLAFLSLPLFLLVLDRIDGRIGWAWPIGIPIAIIVELSFGLALFAGARLRWKPLLTLSFLFLAATLSCLGIDGSLSAAISGQPRLGWSAVVAAAVIPISAFLTYVHFRIPHVARLKRLFHL